MIGQAQTGSGKTAAFGLPMLQYVDPSEHEVQGLVLTPTRELCIQVTQALRTYGARKGVDVVAVFGGAPIRTQQAQLRAGGHIVVGTVGRVKDLISRHSLMLHSCRFVVLDEADEMLDLGFLEDVERILVADAVEPPDGAVLGDDAARDPAPRRPVPVRPGHGQGQDGDADRRHASSSSRSRSQPRDKADTLVEVLEAERPEQAIVFVRTKIRCDQLYRTLRDRGMNVKALHGDMTQGARDGVMIIVQGRAACRCWSRPMSAARGLDISGVSHVINFDVPTSPDVYVHRIGRTGRVGRSGRAITFYEPRQRARDRGDRGARRRQAVALGQGRARRADARQASAQAPLQAARARADGRAAAAQADRRGRPRRRGRAHRTSSTRSPRPPASTARPCATCACSSASASSRCPSRTPSGSSSPLSGPRCAAGRCASSSLEPDRASAVRGVG